MAIADEMIMRMKCSVVNEDLLDFYDNDWTEDKLREKGFSSALLDTYNDAEENFLGNLALLFCKKDAEDKFFITFRKAWRSFIDGISYNDGVLEVYFRSANGGSKEFFQALYDAYHDNIKEIVITIDDDVDENTLEFLHDEYGDNFEIRIGC